MLCNYTLKLEVFQVVCPWSLGRSPHTQGTVGLVIAGATGTGGTVIGGLMIGGDVATGGMVIAQAATA